MWKIKHAVPTTHTRTLGALLLAGAVIIGSAPGVSHAKDRRFETIEASAEGTGTQQGQVIGVTLVIYDYSAPEDRQVLVDAFTKGQNQGLVNALTKMKAVGRVSITGTLGYDCSYIKMISTPTGRKIRFITNRQIRFGEAFFDTQSMSYNLTGGEFDLNDQDKHLSSGVLLPAAQLVLDKQGQLQIDLNQNSWKLADVLDWPPKE